MKTEFKKVPNYEKELNVKFDSVRIEGTFCRISQSLIKIDAFLKGDTQIDCCRCGQTKVIKIDEKLNLLLSDGIYKNDECEELVIEIENSLIDFDEIIQSELNSIKSDYYICEDCLQDNSDFEQEF